MNPQYGDFQPFYFYLRNSVQMEFYPETWANKTDRRRATLVEVSQCQLRSVLEIARNVLFPPLDLPSPLCPANLSHPSELSLAMTSLGKGSLNIHGCGISYVF